MAAWIGGCARPGRPRPSVLLVTLEAVRADRLGAYGYAPARTARLDALAREGVLFEKAYAAAPLCRPAVTTVLTGRGPASHRVREDVGVSLAESVPLVTEVFRSQGYRTGAFVGSSVLGRSSGLFRGFEQWVDDFGAPGKRSGRAEPGTPEETAAAALRWLETTGSSELVFAWVHLERTTASDSYDASLAATDAGLGRLVDGFRRARPSLAVAVLADHGEALGDHGEDGFGYFVYSATTRVPLLISFPEALSRRRVASVVRSMDVAPTLLDLAGVAALPGLEGASLVPLMTGRVAEGPGPALIENLSLVSRYGLSPLFAIRSGAHLYIRAPRPELYDSDQDPGERVDLAERLARVATRLDTELPRSVEDRPGLADPKAALDLYHRYREAQDLDDRGDRRRAIEGYRAVLADAPGFVFAERKLAGALLAEKQTAEAVRLFEGLVQRKQGNESTYLNLALARYRNGELDGALRGLREGVQALPASAALHHRAGRLLLELKRPADAVTELTRAVELEPRLLDAHLALGSACESLGRLPEAEASYRRVLDIAGAGSSDGQEASAGLARLAARPR
jgi:arylsulfatase A-like enzyme/Flp pilus assembly protein TadD